MKIRTLESVAHNIADSLGSGIRLLVGAYNFDIFSAVRLSPNRYFLVDFIKGSVSGGKPTPSLGRVVKLYRDALPKLCAKHGALRENFREFTARYSSINRVERTLVTIRDSHGRSRVREYVVVRPGGSVPWTGRGEFPSDSAQ
jgi:hypothetical protein